MGQSMRILVRFGSLLIWMGALVPAHPQIMQKDDDNDSSMSQLAMGNMAFAADLYNQLKDKPGNLFFSPFSISTALAMAYAGARGKTAGEMENALHFDQKQEIHAEF